jgi:hypothetical protein
MTFPKLTARSWICKATLLTSALVLAACAGTDMDVDDTTGSHLAQPPVGTPPEPTVEAGDVAIAAQEFSHSIRDLPQIANSTTPPLVKFNGVTSIIRDKNNQLAPIDTEPYTALLRDRLLLGDREKLRFIERQLPPLTTESKHGKHATEGAIESDSPDYEVLAELRGRAESDVYRIQIEFEDTRSGDVLFSAVYRIHREAPGSSDNDVSGSDEQQEPIPQSPEVSPSAAAPAANVDQQSDVPAATSQYQPPPPPQGRDDGN